jgi:glycosyltransferase involved in cell wall biosynthesis
MKKIKILHIIKSLGRGGAEMLLPETLRLHNKNEFEFHCIYFLPWKDQMVEAIREQGGVVLCIPANNNIQLMLRTKAVAKYVRENKIDVIHAHLPWAGVLARIVGKITKVPVLYTEHNKQERYHLATRFMNLSTMPWLSRVIAVSKDVEESIVKHKAELSVPVQTILNGVNTSRFSPGYPGSEDIKNHFDIPANALVIGTVAVFRFQKRLDLWMEIAKKILEQNPETHFIIVGDGPLRDQLHLKCTQLGMERNIHFAGLQTEVRPYFAAFDIYMMSSIFEGLPIALLEAMSSGCTALCTDAGGIKEVIRHEVDGLICSVDEPNRLVDMAGILIQNAEKRKLLTVQGRKRIEEKFSLNTMVGELEAVYRKEI